jgi:hypothetical protein
MFPSKQDGQRQPCLRHARLCPFSTPPPVSKYHYSKLIKALICNELRTYFKAESPPGVSRGISLIRARPKGSRSFST